MGIFDNPYATGAGNLFSSLSSLLGKIGGSGIKRPTNTIPKNYTLPNGYGGQVTPDTMAGTGMPGSTGGGFPSWGSGVPKPQPGVPGWGTGGGNRVNAGVPSVNGSVNAAPRGAESDIYAQLMALASRGTPASNSFDLKGALGDVNNSYAPALANLDKIAKTKTAREQANELSLQQIYEQLNSRLGENASQSNATFDKTMGANSANYGKSVEDTNAAAQARIAAMTEDYNRLGQSQRIGEDTQKILNQRDSALERIKSQDAALHGSLQTLQGANQNWHTQGQGISRFEGANARRDQKMLLEDALNGLDTQRAGILGNRAQAQSAARQQYSASAKPASGPDIGQMLDILSSKDSHEKLLYDRQNAGSTDQADQQAALDKLIQQGGLNGASAYIQAANLSPEYDTMLRRFISESKTWEEGTNHTNTPQETIVKALGYAKANGADEATFRNIIMKYLKL